MPNLRVKGIDTKVMVVVDGVAQLTLNFIRNLEATLKFAKSQEKYLGFTTDLYDETFEGVDGRMGFHYANATAYNLAQSVMDRARRRTPGTVINVKTTVQFPDGSRALLLFADVSFGNIPLAFPGKNEFGTIELDWSCSDGKFVQA